MPEKTVAVSNFNQIPGQLYLWLAVIIFAAANSITRKLTEIGSQHLIDGRNPISLCNVLFIGNICALLVLVSIHWRLLSFRSLRQFSFKDWSSMVAVAILSGAIAPAAIFTALSQTMVNDVVIIGRIEPSITLALSIWLLGERANKWEIAGAIISFLGLAITILLQSLSGYMTQSGNVTLSEILVMTGTITVAISNVIGRANLKRIPIGIFSIVRTGLGTVIFFFAAILLYGKHHFMDAFSPFLWRWMLVYGTVIVVFGQSLWLAGLKKSSGSLAALISAFNPIAAFFIAYLVLGEVPTLAQLIGGGVILLGILLGQIGNWYKPVPPNSAINVSNHQKIETGVGFKGI